MKKKEKKRKTIREKAEVYAKSCEVPHDPDAMYHECMRMASFCAGYRAAQRAERRRK